MRRVELAHPADASGWRDVARRLLGQGVRPESVTWTARHDTESGRGGSPCDDAARAAGPADGFAHDLFAGGGGEPCVGTGPPVHAPRVPAAFVELAERVACNRSAQRFALLYRVLWRLQHGEPRLLDNAADADVHTLHRWGKAVSRDRHKMHAFVRFRATPGVPEPHYSAWFEPDHRIERLAAGFFCRRFTTMRFSIVTPDLSLHWDTERLRFGAGGSREALCRDDGMEALWCEYFASIFNPARLKLDAMRAEMPVKYWKNLPEAPLIARLTRDAGPRSASMVAAEATVAPRFARAAGLSDAALSLQSRPPAADDPA